MRIPNPQLSKRTAILMIATAAVVELTVAAAWLNQPEPVEPPVAVGETHTDACLTSLAAPILSAMGLSGVEVRWATLDLGVTGVVTADQPDRIVIEENLAFTCPIQDAETFLDGEWQPSQVILQQVIAREAAHVAELRLAGSGQP